MYKIVYHYFQDKPFAYFNDYSECKKALEILKKRHPENKTIRMQNVIVTQSVEEFVDKTNGEIYDYIKF